MSKLNTFGLGVFFTWHIFLINDRIILNKGSKVMVKSNSIELKRWTREIEDNNITTLLEGDDTQNTSVDLEKGTARIILVGDHANGSCEITLNETNNVSVAPPSGGLDSEEWINDFFDDWM